MENPEAFGQSHKRDSEDLRIRELELSTEYELMFLKEGILDLKKCFDKKTKEETDRFASVTKRINLLTVVIIAQLAGLNLPALSSLIKAIPI